MENNRQEFKKRLKGLLGFILSVCIVVSLNSTLAYAYTVGYEGETGTMTTVVVGDNENLDTLSGGGIYIATQNGLNPGSTTYAYGGKTYYRTVTVNTNSNYNFVEMIKLDGFGPIANDEQYAIFADGAYSETVPTRTVVVPYQVSIIPNATIVKVDANGGTCSNGSEVETMAPFRFGLTTLDSNPTRAGYRLLGYSENPQATEVTYQSGSTIPTPEAGFSEPITLYAVWESDATPEEARLLGSHWLEAGKYYYLGGTKSTDGYKYNIGTKVYVREDGYYYVFE